MLRGTGINHELVTGTISGLDGLHGYLVRLHRVDDLQHLAAEGMWEQSAQQSDAGKRDYFAEITGLDKLGKNPAKAKTGTEIDPVVKRFGRIRRWLRLTRWDCQRSCL